jgi:hypothetical protein
MKRTCAIVVLLLGITAILLVSRRPSPTQVAPGTAISQESAKPISRTTNDTALEQRLRSAGAQAGPETDVAEAPSTNILARLLKGEGEPPRISREQADAFASANGRRAEALLAAWQASGDRSFLREAMENFPADPHVAYMAWTKSGGVDSPEESAKAKAEWLEKFKQAAPDNAVGNYLSARSLMKAGDVDAALRELSDGQAKPWRDYIHESIQNVEEAYRAAGFSEAESKAIATMGARLPHLSELRGLGKSLDEVAAARRQAGDTASADAALQWSLQLGERTGQEGTMTLIQQLVSVAIQRDAMKGLDPGTPIGNGLTVEQRLAALDQQRESIRQVARESGNIMPRLSEPDLAIYFDRLKLFGEQAAVQWAKARVQPN